MSDSEELITNTEDISRILEDANDSDHEEQTAADIIKLMEETWANEKFAPEILPHKFEFVECLLLQIASMEENLENLESTDFTKSIYQMELERVRYLVSSYLRNRLEKIETFALHILQQENERIEKGEGTYLTESEILFAKEIIDAREQHFDNVLSFWPGVPPDEWKKEPVAPNMYSFVFLKSKSEVEGVIIDDGNDEEGDLVDFKTGSQMILSYNSVANLVKDGQVTLI